LKNTIVEIPGLPKEVISVDTLCKKELYVKNTVAEFRSFGSLPSMKVAQRF
jgi:hypothetical protein